MKETKIHKFRDPKNLGDLRRIVQATQTLDDKTSIDIDKFVGDQRDPGYTTITVAEA